MMTSLSDTTSEDTTHAAAQHLSLAANDANDSEETPQGRPPLKSAEEDGLVSLKDVLASPNAGLRERYLSQIDDAATTKLKYLRAQEPLLVLEFNALGGSLFHELKRDELLALARRAIPKEPYHRKAGRLDAHWSAQPGLDTTKKAQPGQRFDTTKKGQTGAGVDAQKQVIPGVDIMKEQPASRRVEQRISAAEEWHPASWTAGVPQGNDPQRPLSGNSSGAGRSVCSEEEGVGSRTFMSVKSTGGREKGTLRHRDVRLLEKNFAHSKDPAIVVRRHAIILVLPPIRMLILFDRAYLMVPDGADSMLSTFMERLRYADIDPVEEEPFEVTALECAFIVVAHELEKELQALKPRVTTMLRDVKSINAVGLNKIREVKADVLMLLTRVKAIQHAYTEALGSDRDMALMNLSKVHRNPHRYAEEQEATWEADHEEMELLLENYLQLVDGIHAGAEMQEQKVEAAMSVLMIRLDSARNNLLKIELMVASVTSAAAIGALIAGIFGMNLDSDVQESPNWFWPVAGTLVCGTFLSVVLFFCYVQRSGWLIT